MTATLSHRKELCFWGWGYTDEALQPAEAGPLAHLAAGLGAGTEPGPAPRLEDFELPAPRVQVPDTLSSILSATPYDRVTHGYGKSFADLVRMQLRQMPCPPDWVAFPRTEQDISALMDFAAGAGAALIPFGGGTSVCGGVEPDVGGDYSAVISVDLQYLNRVI
jgi:alkyldihydroxyacetonephosphate synthase